MTLKRRVAKLEAHANLHGADVTKLTDDELWDELIRLNEQNFGVGGACVQVCRRTFLVAANCQCGACKSRPLMVPETALDVNIAELQAELERSRPSF